MCVSKSLDQFSSLIELVCYFKNEEICLQYIEDGLHEGEMKCPHCGFDRPYRYKDGRRFKCRNCKVGFTAKIGTIFEKSTLPLVKWFSAMYIMATNSKGVSSINLGKLLKVRQATAWFMMQRIRETMKQDDEKLEGTVSSDETFVGGKNKNRTKSKKLAYSAGRNFKDKVPVLGLMNNDGKVKTFVLPSIAGKEIRMRVMCNVKLDSTLVTDEYKAYKRIAKHFKHKVVRHNIGEYRNKEGYSSNNIEGFWSQLKRMIIGVFHKISKKYLQRYCDELTFRTNCRDMDFPNRLQLMMSRSNSRLTLKKLRQYEAY